MSTRQHIAIAFASLLTASAMTSHAIAGPSAEHLSAASAHSAAASIHAGGSIVKGAAAVAAVPFVAVGVSGVASAAVGSALHDFANEPLRIGHEVIHTEVKTTPTPAQQMGKAGDKS